ncbi:hypothetical protein [Nonomuraea polychroma]|uniref:hypothetical protein n=1 Tax=Nonomuraea polychroma TaxID=46176 RepID=UPI000FDE9A3F|nr:hypothetical protein [Nonomuraea polychroma]
MDAGESEDLDEPWNPRIRRTADHDPGPGPHPGADWPPGGSPEPPAAGWGRGVEHPAERDDWGRGLERDEWGRVPERDDWGRSLQQDGWERGHASNSPLSAPTWDTLPPSARLYGTPVDPGVRRRAGARLWRRWAVVLAALLAGTGLVAGATAVVLRITEPGAEPGRLSDGLAGVTATLPQGWRVAAVPPVTGFTSVVRDGSGGLVMARPVPAGVVDAEEATAEAAELYSRLLLKGDRVSIVEDKEIPGGHTRALRAEYRDVVNRPAFMRVMLITRGDRAVLLLGLLQPEETARRQALDAVMMRIR